MSLSSPEVLKEELETPEARRPVVAFIDDLRGRLDSDSGYIKHLIQAGTQGVNQDSFIQIAHALDPFVQNARPGHDVGHVYRDMMSALALIGNDPFVAKSGHPADVLAGLLGGIYHDVAVAVSPKYLDRDWECGHAEVGAWLFYTASEGILTEPLRALTAYAIAAHTNYLKPMPVTSSVLHDPDWERPVYPDELLPFGNYTGRMAIQLTRFSDRLDNNGVSHFARHVLAMADDAYTAGAQDLSGGAFFDITPEALVRVLTPEIVGGGDEGAPSTLKHMITYRNSNVAEGNPYNKNDHLFPFFGELIALKMAQVDAFVEVATTPVQMDRQLAWDHFESLLRHVSQSRFIDGSLETLRTVWDEHLTDAQCAQWGAASFFGRGSYDATLGEMFSCILRVAQSEVVNATLPIIVAPISVLRR